MNKGYMDLENEGIGSIKKLENGVKEMETKEEVKNDVIYQYFEKTFRGALKAFSIEEAYDYAKTKMFILYPVTKDWGKKSPNERYEWARIGSIKQSVVAEHTKPPTKLCTRCKREKPINSFSKDETKSDGLQSWCKTCHSEYNRKHLSKPIKKVEKNMQTKKNDNNLFSQINIVSAFRKYEYVVGSSKVVIENNEWHYFIDNREFTMSDIDSLQADINNLKTAKTTAEADFSKLSKGSN